MRSVRSQMPPVRSSVVPLPEADQSLASSPLWALTCAWYSVSTVSPVMVHEVSSKVPSANIAGVVHSPGVPSRYRNV